MAMKICAKCGKPRDEEKYFYSYRNGRKAEQCKDCLTMFVNNFQPETFTWILEKLDYPYLDFEWNALRDKAFAKNPNLNGQSVLGRYISKMHLSQYKGYGWDAAAAIMEDRKRRAQQLEEDRKRADEELKKQFEQGQINEAQYKTLASTPQQATDLPVAEVPIDAKILIDENNFVPEEEMPEIEVDLTDDEKTALSIKWGRLYSAAEWVELEKLYKNMEESFDIHDADTINTLILICKSTLKANQALDQGDIEGFQKLSRVLESLRKSAKFTAAQKKETSNDFIDCIGNLVAYCEKTGGKIPKYEIDVPNDIIDTVIKDLKEYNKSLVYEDKALARQIEDYLTQRQTIEMQKLEKAGSTSNSSLELTDKDFVEYYKQKELERENDMKLIQLESESEEEEDY